MACLQLANGLDIYYEDTGGAGVPLIFSHGLFMDHTMFAPQIAAFAPARRCIVWDERAHGKTAYAANFTYWDSARDLLGLMDGLGIDRTVHCGMSQGGLLGMRAALLAPHRFTGLIQLASQAGTLAEADIGPFRALMTAWIENGPDQALLDFLSDLILGPGADTAYWQQRWRAMPPAHIRSALSALYALEDIHARLPELAMPVMVIHGLADASTPYERAGRVANEVAWPGGLSLIKGGPHAVNLTHASEVNAAIAAFLRLRETDHRKINHAVA